MTKILNPPLRARKHFLIPLTWKMKIFWPYSNEIYNFELFQKQLFYLSVSGPTFLTPLKRNVQFWIISKGIFQPPQKECTIFFIPPQAGLQKMLTPLTCWSPPTTAGLKMTNPLVVVFPSNPTHQINSMIRETTKRCSGSIINYGLDAFCK